MIIFLELPLDLTKSGSQVMRHMGNVLTGTGNLSTCATILDMHDCQSVQYLKTEKTSQHVLPGVTGVPWIGNFRHVLPSFQSFTSQQILNMYQHVAEVSHNSIRQTCTACNKCHPWPWQLSTKMYCLYQVSTSFPLFREVSVWTNTCSLQVANNVRQNPLSDILSAPGLPYCRSWGQICQVAHSNVFSKVPHDNLCSRMVSVSPHHNHHK